MADIGDTLKGLLGDGADEKIGSIMSALGGSDSSSALPAGTGGISPELLMQAQGLIRQLSSSAGDSRSALLMSLKPYMRDSRRDIIDQAVKLLNITRLAEVFGKGGLF